MSEDAQVAGRDRAPGAVASLVLGIIGITLFSLASPFAWAQANKAKRAIEASGGRLEGTGLATAGKVLGIIGTVILVLFVLLAVGWVVTMVV